MLNIGAIKKKTGKVKMAKNFKKFKCGIWFNAETLQLLDVDSFNDNYYITQVDIFGDIVESEIELVPLLIKMSQQPFEYLGGV